MQQETFDPTVQSWHSKIDLPTPNPHVLYCIKEIKNFPEPGYCYVTVLMNRALSGESELYEQVLFYNYAPIQGYSSFIEDIKGLVPLHCSRIKDYLVTFHKDEICPCGLQLINTVVEETMQPTFVSLWLRKPEGKFSYANSKEERQNT